MPGPSWRELPPELRAHVAGFLSLGDLDALQGAAPDAAVSGLFGARVARLRPLYKLWAAAVSPRLPSYRNDPEFRQPGARAAATPVAFSRVRRAALGKVCGGGDGGGAGGAARALSALDELTALTMLDVSGNALDALPDGLARCRGIRVLNAGDNALREFPAVVLRLPRLHTLLLYGNPIPRLPRDWAGVPSIRRLGLYNCALRGSVPRALCDLLVRSAAESGRPRTANLSQNAFSEDDVARLFEKYPLLQSRMAI